MSDKAGTAVVGVAIPVLLSGSVAAILALRRPEGATTISSTPSSPCLLPHQCPSFLHRIVQRLIRRHGGGDPDFAQWGILLLVLPCLVYALASTHRHLSGDDDMTLEEKLKETGNSFGIAALMCMAVFLVPVARHSPILQLFGWNAAAAVQLHVWSGRFIVAAVFLHGGMHLWRWKVQGEQWVDMLVPPKQCWTWNYDDDEQCYSLFRNLTGFLTGLACLMIGISSINVVRRKFYGVFYRIHILAGPTILIGTILHWNRSMVWIAGGALYYTASCFPVLVESYQQRRRQDHHVQVLEAKRIAAGQSNQRPCTSLTFSCSDTAMTRYRAGQYVKLSAPNVSSVSHPFTVNMVPSQRNQLRIIFRSMGPFTSQLATAACTASPSPPKLYVQGFHGSPNRVSQALQHDTVVMVAGGIGITPYLSLLHRLQSILSSSTNSFSTQKIILHWTCRDPALIQYIRREYFDPLLQEDRGGGCEMQIIIHRTGIVDGKEVHHVASYSDLEENPQDDPHLHIDTSRDNIAIPSAATDEDETASDGVPFTPSRFSPASKSSYRGNAASFVSFVATAWIGFLGVWVLYTEVQEKSAKIFSRIWSPIFIVLLSGSVAIAVNWSFSHIDSLRDDSDAPEAAKWSPVTPYDHDDEPDEESLELRDMSHSTAAMSGDTDLAPTKETDRRKQQGLTYIQLEERQGRSTIHQFLNCLDEAKQPGLFACGPAPLLAEIRDNVQERCLVRVRQGCCSSHRSPHIALYEEAFEM